jgi:uncharacterized linocin/CFP29 family protein
MPLVENRVQNPDAEPAIRHPAPVLNALGGPQSLPSVDWVRLRQPFLDDRGRACVTVSDLNGGWTVNDSHGGVRRRVPKTYLINDLIARGYPLPVTANAATMTKEAFIEFDRTVVRAFRQELTAAADLEAIGTYGGFNAMGKTVIQYQAMSDPGRAYVDMDAKTDGTTDTPLFDLRSLPLPITHSDFGYSMRELEVSRSGGMPFDDVMVEACTRRVAEAVEDQTLGLVTGPTYGTVSSGPTATGTSVVQGYLTFTGRLTKTNITAPTTGGWVPNTTYNEVLAAIQQLLVQYVKGPFNIYHSLDWTPYMSNVFSVSGGNNAGETLKTMLEKIPQVNKVQLIERLTNTYTVAQMVNGLDVTVVAWELKGGLERRWKVMCIKVPRFFSDYYSRSGVLIATTA